MSSDLSHGPNHSKTKQSKPNGSQFVLIFNWTKKLPFCSKRNTFGKPTSLENQTECYHLNSKCIWYSSLHRTAHLLPTFIFFLIFRWNDFESNISSSFQELRQRSELFDVTLCCDNGKDLVQAHKIILVRYLFIVFVRHIFLS